MIAKRELIAAERYSTIKFNPNNGKYTVKYDGKSIETIVANNCYVANEWFQNICKKYLSTSTVVVGMNAKWRPSTYLSNKSNKAATLQFYIDDRCLILQLLYMDNSAAGLNRFFRDSKFCFVGIGLDEDVDRLTDEYELDFSKCLDIGEAAKMRWPERFNNTNLKDLAREVGGVYMKRPEHVSNSNWGTRMLCHEQVEFACMEAYASYCVGYKLLIDN